MKRVENIITSINEILAHFKMLGRPLKSSSNMFLIKVL